MRWAGGLVTLEWLLLVFFACVALCVVALSVLRAVVERQGRPESPLFAPGSVPPYTAVRSLRAKYLLPWVRPVSLADAGAVAWVCLWVARLGAYGAVAVLVVLVIAAPRL